MPGRGVVAVSAWEYYLAVLLVYAGIFIISAWGLNLEFGVAGIANFAYIALVSVGAYMYAVLTLGPDSNNGGFQTYIIGWHLSPPLAFIVAALVSGLVGGAAGLVGIRKLRPDYQAMAMLVISVIFLTIVQGAGGLFNGNPGVSLVANPAGLTGTASGNWGFLVIVVGCCLISYWLLRRFSDGQMGRTLRALRDNSDAATAVGKDVVGLRIMAQVVGGTLAGLSGALTVAFIGAWSPASWQYVETLSLLTAIIVGGAANNLGAALGAVLIPVGLQQASQYLPSIASRPGLALDLGWVLAGVVTIAFIWLRPKGLVPERRPKLGRAFGVTGPHASPVHEGGHSGQRLSFVTHTAPKAIGVAALAVDGLTVEYEGVRAVDQVSLEIPAGEVWGLIGPNGAGKSSLLGAISGFVPARSGRVVLGGLDVSAMKPHRRVRAGLTRTFQLPHEFMRLTTVENLLVASPGQPGEKLRGVTLGPRAWRSAERGELERAMALLEMFRLDGKADFLAGTLSGGEKRLIEIMRAVMTRPAVLMLDEPAAGLSPAVLPMLQAGLTALAERNITIVLVEHNLAFAEQICDSVVAMARGAVMSIGSMGEVRSRRDVQEAYVNG